MEYNVIGIQCRSGKNLCSPPISIFVKSQCGLVEIMHHRDECKETESSSDDYWVIHAVLARCLFGPKTHDINEGTRRRTEHRYQTRWVLWRAHTPQVCQRSKCHVSKCFQQKWRTKSFFVNPSLQVMDHQSSQFLLGWTKRYEVHSGTSTKTMDTSTKSHVYGRSNQYRRSISFTWSILSPATESSSRSCLDGLTGWHSNMAESEVGFWSAEVEVTLEHFVFDKSWTTGSVDCWPSSLLPVGTETKVNSVLPFQNLSSARFGSSEVLQSSSMTCSVLSSKVTKVFPSQSCQVQLVCLKFLQVWTSSSFDICDI